MTLKMAIELYLDNLEELKRSPETVKTYKKNLDLFCRYLSSRNNCQVYVDDVTADDLEDYLSKEYNSESYSSAYRFNIITAFKCLFTFCYMKGYCKTNIAKQVKQVKRRDRERTYISGAEFEKLITVIDRTIINAVVQTMYYAGLRINECTKLTLDDVDFERNCIIVRKDKEKHTRIIPINYKLRLVLLDYVENWRDNTKNTDQFFATRTGKLSKSYVDTELRTAVRESGFSKEVTCHIMRHSFASNLVANGVDIHKVQVLLGHTSLKTTSIYLHTNMKELRKAVNMIN